MKSKRTRVRCVWALRWMTGELFLQCGRVYDVSVYGWSEAALRSVPLDCRVDVDEDVDVCGRGTCWQEGEG